MKLTVKTGQKKERLGDLFGIFFEDINHAADGGLYAEMVQNRSFEFDTIDNPEYYPMYGWEIISDGKSEIHALIDNKEPLYEKNVHYLVLGVKSSGDRAGVRNAGFNKGMYFKEGEEYIFTVYSKTLDNKNHVLNVSFENDESTESYASYNIEVCSEDWKKTEIILTSSKTDTGGRLVLTMAETGKIALDFVSLFPVKTFKGRKNGMRDDIAQLIAELKPKFMRFPGGCLVNDGSLNPDDRDSLYRWKNTIGPVEMRPARKNSWGYNQTLGLGYYEYFQFAEDIGAKPVPVLAGGFNPHSGQMAPLDKMQEWIDDALDLIEFANGSTDSKWGAERAKLGHSEPFGLEYIAIGNEEVSDAFFERYEIIHKAVKEKYPEIKVINTAGPFASGSEFERGWASAVRCGSDFVDEHYYMAPEWFIANHYRYDSYGERKPKVFLGEYASWGNEWYNALAEASYMIGLERNAGVVRLASYAPLLCNINYINQRVGLIWFNNSQAVGMPEYYVQKLFMNYQGNVRLESCMEGMERPVVYRENFSGGIKLKARDSGIRFEGVQIINDDTKRVTDYNDCALDGSEEYTLEGSFSLNNFTIKCKAKMVSGENGFKIITGFTDEDNYFAVEFGNGKNKDCIIRRHSGNAQSVLSHCCFTMEYDRYYDICIQIIQDKITVFIDNKEMLYAIHKAAVKEQLYYEAAFDENNGTGILKLVNLHEYIVKTDIVLDGDIELGQKLKVIALAASGESSNNFENPYYVSPKESEIEFEDHIFEYEVLPLSVTFIIWKQQ